MPMMIRRVSAEPSYGRLVVVPRRASHRAMSCAHTGDAAGPEARLLECDQPGRRDRGCSYPRTRAHWLIFRGTRLFCWSLATVALAARLQGHHGKFSQPPVRRADPTADREGKELGTAVREFTARHARAGADDDSRRPGASAGRATPNAHRLRTPGSDGGAHGPLVRRHIERRRVRRAPRLHLARRGVATRIYAHARRCNSRSRGVAPASGSDVRGRGMARNGRDDVHREQSRRTLPRAAQGADAAR